MFEKCLRSMMLKKCIRPQLRYNLQTRVEIRSYWEERNRERFDRISMMPHKPGQEALWAKLEEQKARRATHKQ